MIRPTVRPPDSTCGPTLHRRGRGRECMANLRHRSGRGERTCPVASAACEISGFPPVAPRCSPLRPLQHPRLPVCLLSHSLPRAGRAGLAVSLSLPFSGTARRSGRVRPPPGCQSPCPPRSAGGVNAPTGSADRGRFSRSGPVRSAGSRCQRLRTRDPAAEVPAEHRLPVDLAQPAPDPEELRRLQGVPAAVAQHRAARADALGRVLP